MRDVFFQKVHELYSNKFIPAGCQLRTFNFIKNKSFLIVKYCTAFAASFARIVRTSPTRTNEKDYMQLVTVVYY